MSNIDALLIPPPDTQPKPIEAGFENIDDVDDPCSVSNIAISNNIQHILPSDTGGENDYNPGF